MRSYIAVLLLAVASVSYGASILGHQGYPVKEKEAKIATLYLEKIVNMKNCGDVLAGVSNITKQIVSGTLYRLDYQIENRLYNSVGNCNMVLWVKLDKKFEIQKNSCAPQNPCGEEIMI